MKWSKTLMGFCCLLIVWTAPAQAQDEKEIETKTEAEYPNSDEAPNSYDEERFLWGDGKITSVSKRAQNISEVSNTVYVITRKDIEAFNIVKLTDIFAFVPGLQLFYRNGQEPEVVVRGFPSQYSPRLLVLVDGVTIYTPHTSGVFWSSLPVVVDAIERIEIIRGPASVLYGANAFSGVINIITRGPKDFKGFEARAWAGSLGTYGARATTLLKAGPKGHFRFSGEFSTDNGFGPDNGTQQDDKISSGTVMVDGYIDINDKSKLRLGTWYRRTQADLPINNEFPANSITDDTLYALGQYEAQISTSHTLKFNTFFNEQRVAPRNPATPINTTIKKFDLQLEDTWNHRNKNFLTVGGNYRFNSLKSSLNTPLNETSDLHMASLYANNEFKILQNLILTTGARYEYDSFAQHDWSGRANITWLPHPDHSLRFAVARAIRDLSFNDNALNLGFPAGPNILVATGNTNLEPESVFSAEASYLGLLLNNKLRINTDFFFNNVKNLIVFNTQFQPPNIVATTFLNSDQDVQLYGFEYGLKYRVFDWWDLSFDHSILQQSKNLVGDAPANIINFTNRFEFDFGLTLNLALNWTDKYEFADYFAFVNQPVGSAFRFDVALSQKFLKDQLEVAVVGQSLINDDQTEINGIYRNARRIFGQLTYRFDALNQ